MPVHYLETGSVDPCYNLALEQYVLEHFREGDWLLLWQNANTVVIGLNQNTAEEINAAFVEKHGVNVVRRMTGGGAVYHDLGNLNYSFICDVGNAEELTIRRFTDPVCRALAAMGVDAETSGRNDILVVGKKVSGVAQRITNGRILHHGTLLFDSDPAMIEGALKADPAKFRSKSAKSVRSRVGNIRDYLPADADLAQFRERLLRELTQDGKDNYHLGKLERTLAKADLLILDELSYLSFNRHQSELLFKVISDRSEKSSTIVTTNLPFSKWTELFENTTMVAALIDRLTFRSHVLDMNGDSYRLKATIQSKV